MHVRTAKPDPSQAQKVDPTGVGTEGLRKPPGPFPELSVCRIIVCLSEFFHPEWMNKWSNHSSALRTNSRMNNTHTCCVISLPFAAEFRVKTLHFASRNNLRRRSKPRRKKRAFQFRLHRPVKRFPVALTRGEIFRNVTSLNKRQIKERDAFSFASVCRIICITFSELV